MRRICVAVSLLIAIPVSAGNGATEAWVNVPVPAGIRVQATDLEGPVYTNSDGMTLYIWPQHKQRNGYSGEPPGNPACYDEVLTVTAGLMSPYPPGIKLPDLDSRPSCTDLWPPLFAEEGSEPVGRWSIVDRKDGTKQWAFEEQPVYTSIRDKAPGDVLGGTKRRFGFDSPANRVPIAPPSMLPPGFSVRSTTNGRLLTTDKNYSVYAFDRDTETQIACIDDCLQNWRPIVAPELARAKADWSFIERSPGVRQWVFRGRPLYTYELDQSSWSLQGSDEPGWSNVFTQETPPFPETFTLQATLTGDVLADARGMTIYTYICGDDSQDQLACDHPDDTQVYRLAMCGGGDAERCLEYWPYLEAEPGEPGQNSAWTVISIDPKTGHRAQPEQEDALSVWAYRDRPVYTFGLDKVPGDVRGSGTGEWRGQRNGLKAFFVRDDYMGGTL